MKTDNNSVRLASERPPVARSANSSASLAATQEAGAVSNDEWRPIAGVNPRYQINACGVVRGPRGIRKTQLDADGYVVVTLRGDHNKPVRIYIHRAVLTAFVRPPKPGEVGRHVKDRNILNNHVSNLAWGTQADNMKDRQRDGNDPVGRRNGRAKLNDAAALAIFMRVKQDGESQATLAREYHVDPTTIKQIIDGDTWTHAIPDGWDRDDRLEPSHV